MRLDLMKKTNSLTSSLLLKGNDDSMLADALALARALLHTENLNVHQDFLLISSGEKKIIGVEDILPIIQKGTYPPAIAQKTVIVIDGMDKLSVAAQNKLLVLLEENPYCFVIGIARRDSLLDTVKSRMRIVEYAPCGRADFMKKHSLVEEDGFFYFISSGSDSLFSELYEHKALFYSLRRACMDRDNRKDILSVLHLVKEKDKMAVTESRVLMRSVLLAMSHFFVTVGYERLMVNDMQGVEKCSCLCKVLLTEAEACVESNYTKNDFFNIIVQCVELEEV